MPSLAFRKASICSRFSFSASCTLVVNPQHAIRSRLISYWTLPPPSGSSWYWTRLFLESKVTRKLLNRRWQNAEFTCLSLFSAASSAVPLPVRGELGFSPLREVALRLDTEVPQWLSRLKPP